MSKKKSHQVGSPNLSFGKEEEGDDANSSSLQDQVILGAP